MEPHAVPSEPEPRCYGRYVQKAHPLRLISAGGDVL